MQISRNRSRSWMIGVVAPISGGFFTIDAKIASEVSDKIVPKVIIPMHYSTPKCKLPISGINDYLSGKNNVIAMTSSEIEITQPTLPEQRQIIVIPPSM